ncbi:MAG: hypothetical protein ABW178_07520, partial [Pseudoxanthomonas sp.]
MLLARDVSVQATDRAPIRAIAATAGIDVVDIPAQADVDQRLAQRIQAATAGTDAATPAAVFAQRLAAI